MTRAGGPANINGILYQASRSLAWVARFTLSGTAEGVRLVAEPSGGDLEVQVPSKLTVRHPFEREVSQFKARGNAGTWSLTELIEHVIPDLYLAVDIENAPNSKYAFVTEGRIGSWNPAYDFFRSLAGRTLPAGPPLQALDDSRPVRFARDYTATERELFSRILEVVRGRESAKSEDVLITQRKLWHLLANFRIEEQRSESEVKTELRKLVRACGAGEDQVEEKIMALTAFLLDRARGVLTSFTPAELLAQAGLGTVPITALSRVAAAARANLMDDLASLGYSAAVSVRPPLASSSLPSRVCLAGESGQGKTWAMAAIAERLAEMENNVVVVVRGSGDLDKDLIDAAARLSRDVLGRRGPHDLRDLINDFRELLPPRMEPILTVCLDGVQSTADARRLLDPMQRLDGVRIVFTASPVAAKAISGATDFEGINVSDFTPSELQRFLAGHGWEDAEVPADIRRVIRRPLLARLFTDVAEKGNWHPTSEYELYERYWQGRFLDTDQPDHPADRVCLRRLALAASAGQIAYPWTADDLETYGLGDEARQRLESIGLLRRETGDGASIWHDRLLNWAVAEALVDAVRTGKITLSAFSDALVKLCDAGSARRFGYVPMDAVWLAAEDPAFPPDDGLRVLEALERPNALGRSLYTRLAPTLGRRILPALEKRVGQIQPGDHYAARMFASGLSRIDKTAEIEDELLARLLDDSNPRVQDVALGVLAVRPRTGFLSKIWAIHTARESLEEIEHLISYKRTFPALLASVREDPSWLEQQIDRERAVGEPVWDLAYLLAELGTVEGAAIWRRQKARLFAMPTRRPRSLIRCIHVYRDFQELDRLEDWLAESDDLAGVAALAAIANMDPGRALSRLSRLSASELVIARGWWLPWLLRAEPDRSRDSIRRRIESNPNEMIWAAEVYEGSERAMDLQTFESLLQWLDREIAVFVALPEPRGPVPFGRALSLLAKCNSQAQLQHFETKVGTTLERNVTSLALWMDESEKHYLELNDLLSVLSRIGGDGYASFVRERLRRITPEDYASAFEVAYPCAAEVVAETRGAIARLEADPRARAPSLIGSAVRLAAAGGDVETVIDVAERTPNSVEASVPRLLTSYPPASEATAERLRGNVEGGDGDLRLRSIAGLGLTGRSEGLPPLIDAARRAAPANQETEYAAMRAAAAIIARGITTSVEAFDFESRSGAKIVALRQLGTPEALDRIENYVYEAQSQASDVLDTASTLLHDATRARRVAAWMWPRLRALEFAWWHPAWDLVFRHLDSPDAVNFLRNIATDEARPDRVRAAMALRWLDPVGAFDAAVRAINEYALGHSDLFPMLLELDENRGIDVLVLHLESEQNEVCRMAIGRALRRVAAIQGRLPTMFNSSAASTREAACEIAGWQPESSNRADLLRLAFEDPGARVQRAAVDALQRRDDLLECDGLIQKLRTSTDRRAWNYAQALVDVGDPLILIDRAGGLFIWDALSGQPESLKLAIEKRLERRAKEVHEDAQRRTRDRGEDG